MRLIVGSLILASIAYASTQSSSAFLGTWKTGYCDIEAKEEVKNDKLILAFTNSKEVLIREGNGYISLDTDTSTEVPELYTKSFHTDEFVTSINSGGSFRTDGFHYKHIVDRVGDETQYEAFLNVKSWKTSAQFFVKIRKRNFFGIFTKVGMVSCDFRR